VFSPSKFSFQESRFLRGSVLTLSVIGAFAPWLSSLTDGPYGYLICALISFVVLALFHDYKASLPIDCLEWDAKQNDCVIWYKGQVYQAGRVVQACQYGPVFLVKVHMPTLPFKSLWVWPDMLTQSELRRFRVLVRFAKFT
jgi:hypothetical protein